MQRIVPSPVGSIHNHSYTLYPWNTVCAGLWSQIIWALRGPDVERIAIEAKQDGLVIRWN